jgi:hypothetical protein
VGSGKTIYKDLKFITKSSNILKYFIMETKLSSHDEVLKLRLRVAELKHRLLEVQSTLQRLRRTEKKQKMKESTPPPLKERKEIRKEDCLNNYNNKKEDSTKTTKDNLQEQLFIPPTPAEVQAYMDEIGEHRFSALKFWNYYEAKGWVLGKSKMRFWKCVLDNWVKTEDDKSRRRRGMKVPPAQQNIVTFNAYKPIDNTGTISYAEYERMKKAGKL